MACFTDDQEVYHHIGGLLREAIDDAELGPRFRRTGIVLQYVLDTPASRITIAMREPGRVDFGDTELRPDVVMAMRADLAHSFFLGRLNPTKALALGQIKVDGPISTVLKLVPKVRPLFARYQARLEAAGRSDLLDV